MSTKTPEPGFHVSLSQEDLDKLERLAKQESGPQLRRAQIVMLAGQGKSLDEITDAVQLSRGQVRHWVKEYQTHGLDIFPQQNDDDTANRPLPVPLTEQPNVLPDDRMSEAGRKILAYYFARVLAEEANVRKGAEVDPIHDMRVATRRLRSALRTFRPYYKNRVLKPYEKLLKSLAHALGAVRDLDVLRLKTEEYLQNMSDDNRHGLQPLLDEWQKQFDAARQDLMDILDSKGYVAFVADFAEFVSTPKYGTVHIKHTDASTPYLVRHAVPGLIYERYTSVRVYEAVLPDASLDTLHALRIEAKRFRYLLESLEEVLEPEVKKVIDAAKGLQDHLGDLQDARVAVNTVQNFLRKADETFPTTDIIQYEAAREAEKQRLFTDVPKQWEAFVKPDMRRALAHSISAL